MATTSSRRTSGVGGKGCKEQETSKDSLFSTFSFFSYSSSFRQCRKPWLSGLIYPAKVIASGAGKLLSFFGNDDDDDLSSSSDIDSSGIIWYFKLLGFDYGI
ncbi:unnamed protein product [Amaranthus hypochondriacus]